VTVLLFDIMGTVVRDPFHRELPAFFELSFEDMLAAKEPSTWVRFERGEIDEPTFAREFFADRRPVDADALRARLRESYRFLPGMQALLGELARERVPMHALSNYPVWYRIIEESLGLSRYLEWSFVSCETGVRKPDPNAYRSAAKQLGVEPSACVFIDDREDNCEAARAEGMDAVRFESAPQLRSELAARGVPVTRSDEGS
jgi:HAD superfamily hydrolase (TIGR01509 family)